MATLQPKTFIIDCHICKAKVAAIETGRAERGGWVEEAGEPYGEKLLVGSCPSCSSLFVGETTQIGFKNYDSDDDRWSDIVRVFPKPPKAFLSYRIPKVVTDSLLEADRSLHANANIAACVMLGRALEALCRDVLEEHTANDFISEGSATSNLKKKLMLGEGIKTLRDKEIIDNRLYDWSQQLQAFRNLAAHPEDISYQETTPRICRHLFTPLSNTSTTWPTDTKSSRNEQNNAPSARSSNPSKEHAEPPENLKLAA